MDEPHRAAARDVQQVLGAYREKEDLISVGAYQKGADPMVDIAVELRQEMNDYLRQAPEEPGASYAENRERLLALHQRIQAVRSTLS
jgi:flagellum-specific ATP synthase